MGPHFLTTALHLDLMNMMIKLKIDYFAVSNHGINLDPIPPFVTKLLRRKGRYAIGMME